MIDIHSPYISTLICGICYCPRVVDNMIVNIL